MINLLFLKYYHDTLPPAPKPHLFLKTEIGLLNDSPSALIDPLEDITRDATIIKYNNIF